MAVAVDQVVEEILRLAEEERVPLVGFGSAVRLTDEPAGSRPSDLLPGAAGVVSFAAPVARGVYEVARNAPEMVCRAQSLCYRRLDGLALRIAALLEQAGAQAAPVFGCSPMRLNARRDVAGYVNQVRMAEVAGVGVRGRNGILVNARYGARLMLGGVLTTASLPALPADDDQPGCPPGCRICVDACPVGAIDPDRRRIAVMRCLLHTSRTPTKGRFVLLRALRPAAAARLMNLTSLDEHTLHVCSRCVALCPYGS